MNIEIPDNVRNIRLTVSGRQVTVSFDFGEEEGLPKEGGGDREVLDEGCDAGFCSTEREDDKGDEEGKKEITAQKENALDRKRRLARMRQSRRREKLRDRKRDNCVTQRDRKRDSVTERDVVCLSDCLIDCNINNLNLKNQSIKQTDRKARSGEQECSPSQKSVARASQRVARGRDNKAGAGQLWLTLTYEDERPELQDPDIQDGYRRWVEMRNRQMTFRMSEVLHRDFLDQLATIVATAGKKEALRWLNLQIAEKRLNRPLPYEPPPRPKPPPPPPPPEPQLSPEQEAEYLAKEEDFYRKLGGDAWKRYLKKKNE
ncbi:MAG: hypothetical protein Q4D62_08040 [Planctomycetia bacterium]|nr:hypothetical protein [Planctomycetia bacterium]